METIILAAVSAGILGLVFSALLIYSSTVFHVEVDEKVQKIEDVLPSVNCGACGCASCSALAEQIVKGEAKPDACIPGGREVANQIAEIMGLELGAETGKERAYVFCRGGNHSIQDSLIYDGYKTCTAAHLSGGHKGCSYGCVGFGDCVSACKFDAIYIDEVDGLPKVIEERCTACGVCVTACPKGLIEIHPAQQPVHIYCKSKDRGPNAKKNCPFACIACKICVKNTEEGAINMQGDLAVVNYDDYKLENIEGIKCPTKAISDEDINAV